MKYTEWISGEYSAICDVCGWSFRNVELKERWDGMRVCQKDWEARHPQELIRPRDNNPPLPWTRPEAPDRFVEVTYNTYVCTVSGRQGVADFGTANCALSDFDLGIRTHG
jgi:hypothetical protein